MKKNRKHWIVFCVVFLQIFLVCGQNSFNIVDTTNLKKDLWILSSDSLIGRESGTPGEWMAAKYIESRFKEIGMTPCFDTSYFQPFQIKSASCIAKGTAMTLNAKPLRLYLDFYPVGFSCNGAFSGDLILVGNGVFCPEKNINDYSVVKDLTGKIALISLAIPDNYLSENIINDSSTKFVRVRRAARMGAIGVVFYSDNPDYGTPVKTPGLYADTSSIPVVFLCKNTLINPADPGSVSIDVNICHGSRTAYNVCGMIDNHAATTVVIGAHYDHLGMGAFSTRDFDNTDVHNGADDNGSGTVGIIELARLLRTSPYKNNNYAIVAFSGEELGLLGSAYYTKNCPVPLESINYMINLDMIGRMSQHNMKIYGTGTSDVWNKTINASDISGLKIKKIKTGIGGSDHTSFFFKKIPALFIHTGLHKDYHTATDDYNLINFKGMAEVLNLTMEIIKNLDNAGKIKFSTKGTINKIMY
jgi:hypothetical protein